MSDELRSFLEKKVSNQLEQNRLDFNSVCGCAASEGSDATIKINAVISPSGNVEITTEFSRKYAVKDKVTIEDWRQHSLSFEEEGDEG